MAIQEVWIEDGCISCGLCVKECPQVFEMEDIAVVRDNVNFSDHEVAIKSAAENCPVDVIKLK